MILPCATSARRHESVEEPPEVSVNTTAAMSDSSERIPYDYAPSEEEDDGDYACAESSQDLNFRKSAPPSGKLLRGCLLSLRR